MRGVLDGKRIGGLRACFLCVSKTRHAVDVKAFWFKRIPDVLSFRVQSQYRVPGTRFSLAQSQFGTARLGEKRPDSRSCETWRVTTNAGSRVYVLGPWRAALGACLLRETRVFVAGCAAQRPQDTLRWQVVQ